MANATTTRLTHRVGNKPMIHTTATKVKAVNTVNTLISKGISQTRALETVSGPLKVTSQTVQNWRLKYKGSTVLNDNGSTENFSHIQHSPGRFTIGSVNLRTSNGVNIKLSLEDIQQIANLAGYIS